MTVFKIFYVVFQRCQKARVGGFRIYTAYIWFVPLDILQIYAVYIRNPPTLYICTSRTPFPGSSADGRAFVRDAVNVVLSQDDGLCVSRLIGLECSQRCNALGMWAATCGGGCLDDDLLLEEDTFDNESVPIGGRIALGCTWTSVSFGIVPLIGAIQLPHRRRKGLRVCFVATISPISKT